MANYNIEQIVKRIVERSFPSVGSPIAYAKPSHYIEINNPSVDSLDVDIEKSRDGRFYFVSGFSEWEGDQIVAE